MNECSAIGSYLMRLGLGVLEGQSLQLLLDAVQPQQPRKRRKYLRDGVGTVAAAGVSAHGAIAVCGTPLLWNTSLSKCMEPMAEDMHVSLALIGPPTCSVSSAIFFCLCGGMLSSVRMLCSRSASFTMMMRTYDHRNSCKSADFQRPSLPSNCESFVSSHGSLDAVLQLN